MVRVARWTRVKPGCEADYQKWHREVWPDLLALISRSGIRNYSIYMHGCDLFSYLEVDDWDAAMQYLGQQEVAQRWQELMAPLMDASDVLSPWLRVEEVFHLE